MWIQEQAPDGGWFDSVGLPHQATPADALTKCRRWQRTFPNRKCRLIQRSDKVIEVEADAGPPPPNVVAILEQIAVVADHFTQQAFPVGSYADECSCTAKRLMRELAEARRAPVDSESMTAEYAALLEVARCAQRAVNKAYLRAGQHEDCHVHPALIQSLGAALDTLSAVRRGKEQS